MKTASIRLALAVLAFLTISTTAFARPSPDAYHHRTPASSHVAQGNAPGQSNSPVPVPDGDENQEAVEGQQLSSITQNIFATLFSNLRVMVYAPSALFSGAVSASLNVLFNGPLEEARMALPRQFDRLFASINLPTTSQELVRRSFIYSLVRPYSHGIATFLLALGFLIALVLIALSDLTNSSVRVGDWLSEMMKVCVIGLIAFGGEGFVLLLFRAINEMLAAFCAGACSNGGQWANAIIASQRDSAVTQMISFFGAFLNIGVMSMIIMLRDLLITAFFLFLPIALAAGALPVVSSLVSPILNTLFNIIAMTLCMGMLFYLGNVQFLGGIGAFARIAIGIGLSIILLILTLSTIGSFLSIGVNTVNVGKDALRSLSTIPVAARNAAGQVTAAPMSAAYALSGSTHSGFSPSSAYGFSQSRQFAQTTSSSKASEAQGVSKKALATYAAAAAINRWATSSSASSSSSTPTSTTSTADKQAVEKGEKASSPLGSIPSSAADAVETLAKGKTIAGGSAAADALAKGKTVAGGSAAAGALANGRTIAAGASVGGAIAKGKVIAAGAGVGGVGGALVATGIVGLSVAQETANKMKQEREKNKSEGAIEGGDSSATGFKGGNTMTLSGPSEQEATPKNANSLSTYNSILPHTADVSSRSSNAQENNEMARGATLTSYLYKQTEKTGNDKQPEKTGNDNKSPSAKGKATGSKM